MAGSKVAPETARDDALDHLHDTIDSQDFDSLGDDVADAKRTLSDSDASLPPSFLKKVGYWAWVVAILILELKIVRKVNRTNADLYKEATMPFMYKHTWWVKGVFMTAAHFAIDGYTLFHLNCLRPDWGLRASSHGGRPALKRPQEDSVLIRHGLKLIMRVPHIAASGNGALFGFYHGYTVTQMALMVVSPTLFGMILAMKSERVLRRCAAINAAFAVACAMSAPWAYHHLPTLKARYMEDMNGDPRGRILFVALPMLTTMPFVLSSTLFNASGRETFHNAKNILRVVLTGDVAAGSATATGVPTSGSSASWAERSVVARRRVDGAPLYIPDHAEQSLARFKTLSLVVFPIVALINVADVSDWRELADAREMLSSSAPLAAATAMQALAPLALCVLLSTSSWRKWLHADFTRNAAIARVALVAAFAIYSTALFSFRSDASAASDEERLRMVKDRWVPRFVFIAAASHAAVPSAPRAALLAAFVDCGVLALSAVTLSASALVNAFKSDGVGSVVGAFASLTGPIGAFAVFYLCAVHLSSLLDAMRGAEFDPKFYFTRGDIPKDGSAHWRMDEYDVDPVGLRIARKALRNVGDHRFDYEEEKYGDAGIRPGMRAGGGDLGPMTLADAPTTRRERLLAAARAKTPAAGSGGGDGAATDVVICRAVGCRRDCAGAGNNPIAVGLRLCSHHIAAVDPFACESETSLTLFCLICRRAHAAPRCETALASRLLRVSVDSERDPSVHRPERDDEMRNRHLRAPQHDVVSAYGAPRATTLTTAANGGAMTRRADLVKTTAWFKTEEDPIEAMAKLAATIRDRAAYPGGVILHAEASARPGCTLLTVDVLARRLPDSDDASFCGPIADADREGMYDIDDEVDQVAARLAAVGADHGLEGTLDLAAQNATCSSRRRRVRYAGGFARGVHVDPTPNVRVGAKMRAAIRAANDPSTRMRVLWSDEYECFIMPSAPEGYSYVLRCRGRFVPMFATTPSYPETDTIVLHVTPTGAEGLAFLELVADAGGRKTGDGAFGNAAPIICVPVFMSTDPALVKELTSDGRCARLGNTPALFNLGIALAAAAAVAEGEDPRVEGETASGEITFHAAAACATMGWATAVTRTIATLYDADAAYGGDGGFGGGGDGGDGTARTMSEGPDTDSQRNSSFDDKMDESLGAFADQVEPRVSNTLFTKIGIATLLRAACSSGDSATVNAVLAVLIRHRGVSYVSDVMRGGDGGWTPLNAAAAAIARDAVRDASAGRIRPPSRAVGDGLGVGQLFKRGDAAAPDAVKLVTSLLVVSDDPLCWVSRHAGSVFGTPAYILANAPLEDADPRAMTRAKRALRAVGDGVIDVLAEPVVRACDLLHLARTRTGDTQRIFNGGGALLSVHLSMMFRDEETHFAAATAHAANTFDGSVSHTLAAMIISKSSSHCWGALQRRDLDEMRGAVTLDEAKEWLRAGAPADGFPPPRCSEVVSARYGVVALVFNACVNAAVFASFGARSGFGVNGEDRGGWLEKAIVATQLLASVAILAVPRRVYVSRHRAVNAAVRLASMLCVMRGASSASSIVCVWVAMSAASQSVLAPAGAAAEAGLIALGAAAFAGARFAASVGGAQQRGRGAPGPEENSTHQCATVVSFWLAFVSLALCACLAAQKKVAESFCKLDKLQLSEMKHWKKI